MFGGGRWGIALFVALVGQLTLLAGASAWAVTIGVTKITNNGNPNVGTQLSIDVTDAGSGTVRFTFQNAGPIGSSITDIYFDADVSLLDFGSATLQNGSGVNYSFGASPANLPAGNSVGFSASFGLDSNPPIPANGINPNETLAVVLALAGTNTFDSVISALFAGLLRIGLHVQAIGSAEGSDSYISQTPLPGALPLLASGLAGLGFLRWLKRRKLVAA
jgi:hypothetical protein